MIKQKAVVHHANTALNVFNPLRGGQAIGKATPDARIHAVRLTRPAIQHHAPVLQIRDRVLEIFWTRPLDSGMHNKGAGQAAPNVFITELRCSFKKLRRTTGSFQDANGQHRAESFGSKGILTGARRKI